MKKTKVIAALDDHDQEEPRTIEQILAVDEVFTNMVWHEHHCVALEKIKNGEIAPYRPDILAGAIKSARKLEEEYGKANLGPYSDFEWGMLNGKLLAIRWVLGDSWDLLCL